MRYINVEGYADQTAGTAISNIEQEKRKEKVKMAKKRNCRRTTDENIIHEKAVKMRKMTDEQLVNYVNDRVEKARSEGYNREKSTGKGVADFLDDIQKAKTPGIGAVTISKLLKMAHDNGYIQKEQ